MKSNLFKNKKGSVNDPINMSAYLLIAAITIFISFYIWTGFGDTMKITAVGSAGEEVINQTIDTLTVSYSYIDYMIPLLVVGFMILSLVLAFKTGANIVYAFLSLISWGFAILMSLVFTDIFELFANSFPSVATSYPILSFIMTNMKWVVLCWLFLISIVIFTRNKREDVALNNGLATVYS